MHRILNLRKRIIVFFLAMVTISTFLLNQPVCASERLIICGLGIESGNLDVYDLPGGSKIGTIYSEEGCTILDYYSDYGEYYKIEYSTPNGPKRGYVLMQYIYNYTNTTPATVTQYTEVWYGSDADVYQKSGAVYAGETVALLNVGDYWAYIEYNTTQGRKRGYVPYKYLNPQYTIPTGMIKYPIEVPYVGSYTVYSGPSPQYVAVGSVSNEYVNLLEIVTFGDRRAWYITYNVPGQKMKAGYIMIN